MGVNALLQQQRAAQAFECGVISINEYRELGFSPGWMTANDGWPKGPQDAGYQWPERTPWQEWWRADAVVKPGLVFLIMFVVVRILQLHN